jgi:hypothetical protein
MGLLLVGCPSDPTPITSDSEASSSSGDAVDSTTQMPDPDTSTSTTVDPDGSSTSNTTVDPDTSTGPIDDCGNGAIDGDEVCDGDELAGATCLSEGFDEGTLACRADCADYDRSGCASFGCGNGVLEEREACDGADLGGVTCQSEGFDSGTPTCSNDCSELDLGECGTCGNVIVDGDEVCDDLALLGQTCVSQGFDSGQLGCMGDCLAYDTTPCGTCGNALVDGAEPCDGALVSGQTCLSQGFDSGTIACAEDCETFAIEGCGTCGNGEIDGDEFCDAPDLAGQTCVSQGFDSGQLGCTAGCDAYTTAGCGDCGNGVIDGSESCDGLLLGANTCASLGLQGGEIACGPSCQYDFSGCDIVGFPFGSDGSYNGFSLMPGLLPCDDISATGTATNLFDDDQATVPIGFTLDFYDTPFTEATITSNGVVYFDTPDFLQLSGVCPPEDDPFSLSDEFILAAFWDDLDPSSAGNVYYQTLGPVGDQRFVVQWDVPFFAGDLGDLLRIQAVFHQAGNVDVCYVDTLSAGDFRDNGATAAAGIQRDPLQGFSFGCSMPVLTSGLLLMYLPT